MKRPSPKLANESFCYVTTTGRVTGKPHEIEIWFTLSGPTIYLLAGGGARSDWVRNLQVDPNVSVRIADKLFTGTARLSLVGAEAEEARSMVFEKYQPTYQGDLSDWRGSALPVAIDLGEL